MPNLILGGKGTKLHSRFMKWPVRLSSILGLVVFLNIAIHTSIFLERSSLAVSFQFMIAFIASMVGAFISLEIMLVSRGAMISRRMWEWGKYRFDTWEELVTFWAITPAEELEKLADQED
jgi:hypothetical protein